MKYSALSVKFGTSCARYPKAILFSGTALIALCLMLFSSGCANTQSIPMVIPSCKGLDQWVVPTKEPEAANQTEGSKDETHAELQGALASCNLDKKAIRDAVQQINKGEKK